MYLTFVKDDTLQNSEECRQRHRRTSAGRPAPAPYLLATDECLHQRSALWHGSYPEKTQFRSRRGDNVHNQSGQHAQPTRSQVQPLVWECIAAAVASRVLPDFFYTCSTIVTTDVPPEPPTL